MTEKIATLASAAQNLAGNASYLAAEWAGALEVYPIYAEMANEFELGKPCADLEGSPVSPKFEQVQRARNWLDDMDQRILVQHFRQFLQSALRQNPSEKSLRALVLRHLLRPKKSPSDGEKVDFLLVQYFALCAPAEISRQTLQMEGVAEVLKPVLGKVEIRPLEWFAQLEELVQGLGECRSLRDIMETGYLEQGRELKSAAGDMFYNPSALVAFVRFNFLVRRAFIQLMHADLTAIRDALQKLENKGVKTVDCHAAGLSNEETVLALSKFCSRWTQPFARNYSENSVGQSFGKLLAIRSAVEAAVTGPRPAPTAARAPNGRENIASPATAPHRFTDVLPKLNPSKTRSTASPKTANTRRTSAAQRETQAPSHDGTRVVAALNHKDKSGATIANAAGDTTCASASPEVDPEACMETICEQVISATPTHGRSMSSVEYLKTKILLSSWEVSAFVSDGGKVSEDLRRAVVARLLVAVAMDAIKASGRFPGLAFTLELAHTETTKLQACVEQAKEANNTEAAVNLSITAKRLMAYIEEAEGLQS